MGGPLRCALVLLGLLGAEPADAFSLFPGQSGTPQQALTAAARWADGYGLEGGVQVGVAPGLFQAIGVPEADIPAFQAGTRAGFDAWRQGPLHFDVHFDVATTVDPDSGFEIDLIGLPSSHPVWSGGPNDFAGLANPSIRFGERTLTNGLVAFGDVITGADIYLNTTLMVQLGAVLSLTFQESLDSYVRLIMHEVGHVIGLGHPDQSIFYDTDTDPFNEMPIDPSDPFAELQVSPFFDMDAIMVPRPCPGGAIFCESTTRRQLSFDDRGGLDALYPVPEPGAGLLVFAAGVAATLRRRRGGLA